MTNNSSTDFAPWEEHTVALGSKCICEALFITTAIYPKDSVLFKYMYISYIYSHLASVIKVLRYPPGVILFMDLDDREMIRPKVREKNVLLSCKLAISLLLLKHFFC